MNAINFKKSNTVVIYGSGYSLNEIASSQWEELGKFDSIGFNFFVLQKWIDPTFLIVGDIRPEKSLEFSGRNIKNTYEKYYSHIHGRYQDSLFIVRDDQLKMLPGEFAQTYKYFVVERSANIKHFGKKMDTMWYGQSTLFSALDWAFKMRYDEVIFAGVDLYDYRFFWLPHDTRREPGTPEEKPRWADRKLNKKHPIHKKTLGWFKDYAKVVKGFGIKLFSYNDRSLLLNSKLVKSWSER